MFFSCGLSKSSAYGRRRRGEGRSLSRCGLSQDPFSNTPFNWVIFVPLPPPTSLPSSQLRKNQTLKLEDVSLSGKRPDARDLGRDERWCLKNRRERRGQARPHTSTFGPPRRFLRGASAPRKEYPKENAQLSRELGERKPSVSLANGSEPIDLDHLLPLGGQLVFRSLNCKLSAEFFIGQNESEPIDVHRVLALGKGLVFRN